MTNDKHLWTGMSTLEDFVIGAILSGDDSSVVILLKTLPEEKREKYREIWKREKSRISDLKKGQI